ncbi:Glycogen debranching enzyme (alpha-1,6-glucosidase) [Actinokineospora alba]|uniref:Glycogen debranching enzyme (Alpha-1,6-glucosidase) n=1 Tax=Actinokineospora alba TaxID=504798 RepID=A0A1H0VGY1_9PSEU|nr:glycogen debranching N-terminal domain-containing protein [Actinokineospora alba]TDP67736.1 glycogen debranching enzyme [Actinokineospora alba]SDJ27071.1 Glycogen debranching enzyme (alpha-1,6-glucosidase) [Actinokineospora alba]SDP77710.1 Glycogen debranching enzyme (alpha-1,6-glucosidase) [Actinokineospora alba]
MTAWASSAAPPLSSVGGTGTTTLVDGSTFCQSAMAGDIYPDRPHGLFVSDTRVLSGWRLTLDGQAVDSLGTSSHQPFSAEFVGRAAPHGGQADSTLLVVRERSLDGGMREDLVLRNLSGDPVVVAVCLTVEADFADLFEVKESRVQAHPGVQVEAGAGTLTYTWSADDHTMRMTLSATGDPRIEDGQISFRAEVPARGEWSTRFTVRTSGGGDVAPKASPASRLDAWRNSIPRLTTSDSALAATLRTSASDLGALQIHDPDHPERLVVAAGAPWFMALFGRDSLLTSWMALPLDQRLALGTLQTLADHQGTKVDPLTEEEPGRILHEVRLGREAARALGGGNAYYGTADATPLFVALLGELHRWGLPESELTALLPAADRALAWIDEYGDRDGDLFVEYQRATDQGLLNQGWKDSFDGVNDAAGKLAVAPIALAEVQAYAFAAYTARARIATALGDSATAVKYEDKAARLKEAFNDRFWLPEKGWFAIGLDADKQRIDALTSNLGHCLWCGIVDDDKAASVAEHLTGPAMWTGFGVRTLATTTGAYNPVSYHNGSVWPHDSAIAAAGLMRYGFVEKAQQVAKGILDAAEHFGGRLPELFCGFDRTEFPSPIPYPTSCSPQAWAAAAPILLAQTLLRFQPDLPDGTVQFAPVLPTRMTPIRIESLPLADFRLTLEVTETNSSIEGLPDNLTLTKK